MIRRQPWLDRLHASWDRAPIVWLSGVRRIGKTTLAKSFDDARFLNCDLPSSRRLLDDPERFYPTVREPTLILDEVHRLDDPSLLLKIGADEFRPLKILATGSSTLAATTKFRDSLTGRKRMVHLLPVLYEELATFGADLEKRLLHGGFPEQLLADEVDPSFFPEWVDSYFARDLQALFNVGKRGAFLRLVEILLRNSGGLFDATNLAKQTGVSRPTLLSYVDALQVTHLLYLIRPFHRGGRREILRQPKAYGFDTGFVSHYRQWETLRPEDCGLLWEHLVLETLIAERGLERIRYWRDKEKREVDFVLPGPRDRCDALECKWNARRVSTRNLEAFRKNHPLGRNFVLSPQVEPSYLRELNGVSIVFCNLEQWQRGEASALADDSVSA